MTATTLQRYRATDVDKSACWKLFRYRFLCKVKMLHATPDWVFSDYGIISSGDKAIDAQLMNNHMDMYLTAVDMAMYLDRGVDVIVCSPEDSVYIYELVNRHLADWVEALKNNPHINKGPITELNMFDKLASVVWRVARNYVTEQVGTSHLIASLNKFFINPLGKRGKVIKTQEIEQEHNSRSKEILSLTSRPKKTWDSRNR